MSIANLAFHGFNEDAAKKSIKIRNILLYLVNEFERDIKIVSSTPKFQREMEMSFSKHCNFHVTVDHDSGYMSNHQESNSDSFLENANETLLHSSQSKPIYLSEDALLEKPEVNVTSKHLETKDNDEEKRPFNLEFERNDNSTFISTSPDTVLSSSVVSQETSYSGFDDTKSETSIEIPCSKQIIIENVNSCIVQSDCHNSDNSLKICDNSSLMSQRNTQNSMFSLPCSKDQLEGSESFSALNNITNTINVKNSEKKKKLTLIFSKDNKENIYSVKRKYQSTSPVPNSVPEETDENGDLDKNFIPDTNQVPLDNGSKHLSTTNYEDSSENYLHVDNEKIGQLYVPIDAKGNSEKYLILKKELDLDEIILQQNSPPALEGNKVVLDTSKAAGQAKCDEQSVSTIGTPQKMFENTVDPGLSPDLFENDEEIEEPGKETQGLNFIAEEKYIIKKDQRMLKRTQNSLKGVFPPYSVTVVTLSVDEMLNRLETNKDYFWTNESKSLDTDQNNEKLNTSNESTAVGESKSLLVTGNKDNIDFVSWPKVLLERYHGLHHNRSKISEELEELWSKYGQRYVGAETHSTCTVFETNFVSPTKRKQIKRWAVKSPGRRLSHLAKRRITFSSANLQAGASSSIFGSRARQILVDAKKLDLLSRRRSPRKSPRKALRRSPRKTPSKSPRLKSRTPSSSAKKKLAMRFRELTGEIEKSTVPSISTEKNMFTKRALFQSPDRERNTSLLQPSTSGFFENDLKKPSTKRALFKSPTKSSPLKNSPLKKPLGLGIEKKRKRTDSDDAPPPKLARSVSVDIRPSESEVTTKFNRARSEMSILNTSQVGSSGELSAVHKKKLQWAVYEALRSQNITPAHPQFKTFASVLARVTRRLLPNLTSGGPKECGTTEKMSRISRLHVYAVIKGKSVEEIISDYLRSRQKNVKPHGYIGPEGFINTRSLDISNRENIAQTKVNAQDSLNKKKLEVLGKPKAGTESRIDRIRKVINFGDDNR